MTPDRNLLATLMNNAVSREDAENMIAQIESALIECMIAGRPVTLNGIGRLRVVTSRAKVNAPGPDRGKTRESRKIGLQFPAVLSVGKPY